MAAITSYTKAKLDALLGAKADTSALAAKANTGDLTAHTGDTSNPHSVTKAQVGLGNVDNTSDANKPVSTATASALALKANTSSLAAVATSGAYSDLSGAPDTSQMLTKDNLAEAMSGVWSGMPTWNGDTDVPAAISGLSQTSGVFKASTDGTMGRAVIPIFNKLRGDCRVSFRVKVDTSLANGRRITVGFAEGSPGVVTGGGAKTYEVGYMNKDSGGSSRGIGRVQDNVWGFEELVANGSLVNSREYDISVQFSRYGSLTAGNTNAQVGVRIVDTVDGSVKYQQAILDRSLAPANIVISSNSSTAELSKVRVAMHPLGEIGGPSYTRMRYTTQSSSNEYLSVLTPAKPNGRLVIALHGLWEQDLNWVEASGYATAAFLPMVKALVNAGYTVAAPLMQGSYGSANTAGNLTAQQCVKDAYDFMVNKYGLNRRAYILGNSAGSLTGLIMIETRPFPIAAAYLAEPPVDMVKAWSNTDLKNAWSSNTSLRDQYDPYQRPASDFAGVAMYMLGSASDVVVPKADHMTPFINNRLNPANPAAHRIYWSFDASGSHGDATHFRPTDLLTLFSSNP